VKRYKRKADLYFDTVVFRYISNSKSVNVWHCYNASVSATQRFSYDTLRSGKKLFLRLHQQKLLRLKQKINANAKKKQKQNICKNSTFLENCWK